MSKMIYVQVRGVEMDEMFEYSDYYNIVDAPVSQSMVDAIEARSYYNYSVRARIVDAADVVHVRHVNVGAQVWSNDSANVDECYEWRDAMDDEMVSAIVNHN